MFKFFITKYFDTDFDSYGPTAPLPLIFTPSVGQALDCVLKELLLIAKGEQQNVGPNDAAILMFKRYFTEARQSLERGTEKDLESLRLAGLEKEYGVRIACYVKKNFKAGANDNTLRLYFTNPIEAWLKNPIKEPSFIAELLTRLIKFNASLNDEVAREIIKIA